MHTLPHIPIQSKQLEAEKENKGLNSTSIGDM